ncbi:hypothetical protein Nepgr_013075 [Nepenthes gracilis]|uniref:Uncharacterized protein n=1 Tax=Nepenthes gracilis TaxID=150966 RepID=A0AAD3XNS8_NEPGR|nr:hypothetical protein Nepgr_013075 [Nepenthes gracilis]
MTVGGGSSYRVQVLIKVKPKRKCQVEGPRFKVGLLIWPQDLKNHIVKRCHLSKKANTMHFDCLLPRFWCNDVYGEQRAGIGIYATTKVLAVAMLYQDRDSSDEEQCLFQSANGNFQFKDKNMRFPFNEHW